MEGINFYQLSENELNRLARIARNNPDCFLTQKQLLKILGHIKYQKHLIDGNTSSEDTLIMDSKLVTT